MKTPRFIFMAAALISSLAMYAETGWVYLNNGSVIKGDVTKTDTKVIVITPSGTRYEYPAVEVNRITYEQQREPEVKHVTALNDYATYDRGFWIAAELNGSYVLSLSKSRIPWLSLSAVGGYRFNQFLRAGIGFGMRYYINNDRLRKSGIAWSFPIFANIRGNIISDEYRTVTPYYSFNIGGAIRDGFLIQPTVGIRVGQQRSAFLLGLTYSGQSLTYKSSKNRFVSSIGLTIGYEY